MPQCASEIEQFANDFFSRIAPWQQVFKLFDQLDGVTFFMKDRAGRFVAFSSGALSCLDYGSADSLIGLTDYDLYPKQIADRIANDDHRLYSSQTPFLNLVELLVNPRSTVIGWYVTNKFPIYDSQGQIIGIMGTVQPFDHRRPLFGDSKLGSIVDRIYKNPSVVHPVEELALLAGLSSRQLRRKFKEFVGMPPREFTTLCRVAQVCRALTETEESVATIALNCGFYDQSALAFDFRKAIGLSPREYRERYRRSCRASLSADDSSG